MLKLMRAPAKYIQGKDALLSTYDETKNLGKSFLFICSRSGEKACRAHLEQSFAGKEAAISLHRYVHPGQTLTAGRDRRVYKALDKEHVLIETAEFDKDHRQMPGYNAAKAKTFSDARVTFTEEQVRRECARCLGCGATKVDSYLCIGCGLCTTKCKFDAIHLKKVRDWHAGSYETMPIKVAEGVVKRAGSIVKKAVSK